jgi:hypothetical protein
VLSPGHVFEETEVLSSEKSWTSDSCALVRWHHLADPPQHIHVEPVVPSSALIIWPHENVGFRFFVSARDHFR